MIKITYTPEFKKEFKRLAKKFVSLNQEMQHLTSNLSQNPGLGNPLVKIFLKSDLL
jgi:mRNA-degrading endonuclease YafQ of YafQ-DinJ toxin-antitoxin module